MKPLPLAAFTVLVPFFFACYEIARIVGWPESSLRAFEPWVPTVVAAVTALTAGLVPWFAWLSGDQDRRLYFSS